MDKIQFLESVRALITAQPEGTPLLVASLGNLIRKSLGAGAWASFGYPSLKSVLQDLESNGIVKTEYVGENPVYAVSRGPNPYGLIAPAPPSIPHRPFTVERRLVKDVWQAFISENEPGLRCMNVLTGEVRMNQSTLPTPTNEWREIDPIPRGVQIQWAREVLKDAMPPVDVTTRATLDSTAWYIDFPNALRNQRPSLWSKWNWTRTQMVIEHIEKWCESTGVPSTLIFEKPEGTSEPVLLESHSPSDERRKQLIIEMLARLSLDDLLSLRIPMRYVIDFAQDKNPRVDKI